MGTLPSHGEAARFARNRVRVDNGFRGDKYLTSNVQFFNPSTNAFEYIGKTHTYLTTQHGLRIMAFGVLFDFTGNTNITKVITAADMVQQDWFLEAVNSPEPVDLFVILGHNPVRSARGGTFGTVSEAIRRVHPRTPIQIFGWARSIYGFRCAFG